MERRYFDKGRCVRVSVGIILVIGIFVGLYFASIPLGRKMVDYGHFEASDLVAFIFGFVMIILVGALCCIIGYGLYTVLSKIITAFIDYVYPVDENMIRSFSDFIYPIDPIDTTDV